MKQHELKILEEYFNALADGSKTFELRKNDRDFKVGDSLKLKEIKDNSFTGRFLEYEVSYVLKGGAYGLEEEYCILGIRLYGLGSTSI
ncbi:MAG: ASCH/PUA domain-containing protein [Sarcina sp.]